jgi:lipopolysaccharide/colanic/teichoic acid biosynthesis glycosyltransferase
MSPKGKSLSFYYISKHIVDLIIAVVLLLVLAPVLLAIALLIKRDSPGPAIYKAEILGENGKRFTWYKFRTMIHNNDNSIHKNLVRQYILSGSMKGEKIQNDPRITKIGSILRKYSMDELPQLINVVKGNMSLVGPRPCLPYEYELYNERQKNRLSVIPGMTGLWQVRGRAQVSFNELMEIDLEYIKKRSLLLDLRILVETFKVVVLGVGGF